MNLSKINLKNIIQEELEKLLLEQRTHGGRVTTARTRGQASKEPDARTIEARRARAKRIEARRQAAAKKAGRTVVKTSRGTAPKKVSKPTRLARRTVHGKTGAQRREAERKANLKKNRKFTATRGGGVQNVNAAMHFCRRNPTSPQCTPHGRLTAAGIAEFDSLPESMFSWIKKVPKIVAYQFLQIMKDKLAKHALKKGMKTSALGVEEPIKFLSQEVRNLNISPKLRKKLITNMSVPKGTVKPDPTVKTTTTKPPEPSGAKTTTTGPTAPSGAKTTTTGPSGPSGAKTTTTEPPEPSDAKTTTTTTVKTDTEAAADKAAADTEQETTAISENLKRIIQEELESLLQEHAAEYIWGVKAPYHRTANQYELSILNYDILKEKGKQNADMACG